MIEIKTVDYYTNGRKTIEARNFKANDRVALLSLDVLKAVRERLKLAEKLIKYQEQLCACMFFYDNKTNNDYHKSSIRWRQPVPAIKELMEVKID